eukprot:11220102-Lingulodinium_polyedra.AAC.1
MARYGRTWKGMDRQGQIWADVGAYGQTWTNMDRSEQFWTDMYRSWTDMGRNGGMCTGVHTYRHVWLAARRCVWLCVTRHECGRPCVGTHVYVT